MSSVKQLPPDRSPFRDELTGLTSAAMFRELLSHALLRSRRSPMDLALLRISLDDHSAETADAETEFDPELLRQVAGRIAGPARRRCRRTVRRFGVRRATREHLVTR